MAPALGILPGVAEAGARRTGRSLRAFPLLKPVGDGLGHHGRLGRVVGPEEQRQGQRVSEGQESLAVAAGGQELGGEVAIVVEQGSIEGCDGAPADAVGAAVEDLA